MKTETLSMLHPEFYRAVAQSFIENPLLKAIIAALFSMFTVPLEFVLAIPLFWMIDFGAGVYASRQKEESFDRDKLNKQFVKMAIHITFLIGCTIMANLFNVPQMIYFGFGYIIANEFIFSTIPHLFGDKEAGKIIRHFKEILYNAMGINFRGPKNKQDNESR